MDQNAGVQKGTQTEKGPAERLACLDAFRGFDILVMIFVNYISGMAGVPFILKHAAAEMDTYTLTDVVFPGFLFIVGVAVPLSLGKRIQAGDSILSLLGRIDGRTACLIFLGVLMVNEDSFSAQATGISKELWYFLAYLAAVALWTIYPKETTRGRRIAGLMLRIGGVLLLLFLVFIFRGKTESGSVVWLRPSWWGILGQIGWSYLACSLIYLLFRRDRTALMGFFGLLVAANIGSAYGLLGFLGPLDRLIIRGGQFPCHAAIALAGVIVGTLFAAESDIRCAKDRLKFMLLFGMGLYGSGLLLRPVHGISKIRATESYALVTSGVCCLLFLVFYLIMDVWKLRRWASFLRPIGMNPLLAYILPSIVDSLLHFASAIFRTDAARLLWPYWARGGISGMTNAVVVTGVILLITWMMTRARVVLRV